ncbi:MAG: hypothetical protein BGO67_03665 [Alphaproteobacteria bacterium 41-28]|nr:MAG: hypothetical protein BGO67_03665 [Alphaproteobacteria bacterium 41-28]
MKKFRLQEFKANFSPEEPQFQNLNRADIIPNNISQNMFIELISHLTPVTVQGFNKIRMGNQFDGGYIMLDNLDEITAAYSLGIGGDVSWDLEMAQKHIPIFQYDHTIECLPIEHPLFKFSQLGVGEYSDVDNKIETLQSIMEKNGHDGDCNLILKIDIEGGEWETFDSLDVKYLKKFSQIICEFHDFSRAVEGKWYKRAMQVFKKLQVYHRIIHVHGNNYAPLLIIENVPFPEVLEVTYLRLDNHSFTESQEVYPTSIDRPNNPQCVDIFLGNFKFSEKKIFK